VKELSKIGMHIWKMGISMGARCRSWRTSHPNHLIASQRCFGLSSQKAAGYWKGGVTHLKSSHR
jgi:hypothetical protein